MKNFLEEKKITCRKKCLPIQFFFNFCLKSIEINSIHIILIILRRVWMIEFKKLEVLKYFMRFNELHQNNN